MSAGNADSRSSEHQLRMAQVRQLYFQSPTGHVGSAFLAFMLVLILRNHVSHMALLSWLASYGLIQVFRLGLVWGFRKAGPPADELITWGRRAELLTFVAGLAWGVVPIFLFPADSQLHQMF